MRTRVTAASLAAVAFVALSGVASAQRVVVVIRHAEKVSDSDERLSEAGRARASRLAAMLKDTGITAIYSTDTERARDTAGPLAEALKQKVRIYDKVALFLEALHRDHANEIVLVVGHSNTVAELVKGLGAPDAVTIAKDEYDNLFVVVPKGDSAATLVRLRS